MSSEKEVSVSINGLEAERGEEDDEDVRGEAAPMLGTLPDVTLQHLAPFLPWSSCRSLSQVSFRFRSHFACLLSEAYSLSIKGNAAVGVGDGERHGESISYLSEFFVVQAKMDEHVGVSWEVKTESGVRTVVRKVFGEREARETTASVRISSRDYLEKILQWLLAKFNFRKIHLGVNGLARFFANYTRRVEDLGVSDEVEYLELAERFQPKKLTIFQPTHNNGKRGEVDLDKFPQLEEFMAFGIPMDPEKLLESKIARIRADTISKKIRLKRVLEMIKELKRGALPQKNVKITSEIGPWPVCTSHENWEFLATGRSKFAFYDEIRLGETTNAFLSYSPGCLELLVVDD